jgi:DNA-binding MarR family transcriptional regulator
MRDESKQEQEIDGHAERLVVLAVLDRRRGCTRAQLLAELTGVEAALVERAVSSLEQAGLIEVRRTRLHASAGLRRLDDLDLICL